MLKDYKKSYLVINIILSVLLIFLLANFFFFKHSSFLFLFITLLIPTTILILRYGYERKKRRFTYELIFYLFSYSIVFLLITYFIGLFTGFVRNTYKLNMANLINNIIPYILLIIVSEILRYEIIRKGENSSLAYILVTLVLIITDITIFMTTYDLSAGDGQIKYICAILLPSMFKNIALMYFAKYGGIYQNIVYRLILDLKLVIVPILPNFGLYMDCIINTILPSLMMFLVYLSISFYKPDEELVAPKKKNPFYTYIIFIILIFITLSICVLVSANIDYRIVAIGSGSMSPEINKGDAIIYKKIDYSHIKKGQVLAFKKDGKMIVHRIIRIVELSETERIYYTKGDANEKEDGYPITNDQVLGVVTSKIRYLGIPSVFVSELIN